MWTAAARLMGAKAAASLLGGLLPSSLTTNLGNRRAAAKRNLLAALDGTGRGATASAAEAASVEAAAAALEALNPTPRPLRRRRGAPDLLSGKWELLYTTSRSVNGADKAPFLRPWGPIYQTLDVEAGLARNEEGPPLFAAVDAELSPTSASAVDVQFTRFELFAGLVGFPAPSSARGALDTTYLDDELRVGRGDKGNLFVLRMADGDARL